MYKNIWKGPFMSISVNSINNAAPSFNKNVKKNVINKKFNNETDTFISTSFKGKALTPKTASKATSLAMRVVFAIAGFFGYESAKEIFKAERISKNNEAKLMVLRGAYPEVNNELKQDYDELIRDYILEGYAADATKGEKLLDIFYKKDLKGSDFRFLEDLKTKPELLDKKHAEYLINGKSQRTLDKEQAIKEAELKRLELERVEQERAERERLEKEQARLKEIELQKELEAKLALEKAEAEKSALDVEIPTVEEEIPVMEIINAEEKVEEINEEYVDNFIASVFETNQERGEKLLDILYTKDLKKLSDEDKQLVMDLKLNPELIDEKHNEVLIYGKSLRQRDMELAQEKSLRLVVDMIEKDIDLNADLLIKTKNDRKKINFELTNCLIKKSNVIDDLKKLRKSKASEEKIAKKEEEFEIANSAVGEVVAKKKEINTKIAGLESKIATLNEELTYAKSDLTAYVTKINDAEIAYAEMHGDAI